MGECVDGASAWGVMSPICLQLPARTTEVALLPTSIFQVTVVRAHESTDIRISKVQTCVKALILRSRLPSPRMPSGPGWKVPQRVLFE